MEVRIGPKSVRSNLPVGYVTGGIYDQIELADKGQLGKQVMHFNVRVSRENKFGDAYYERAFVLNGHCRFKRYSLLDLAKIKLLKLLRLA